MGIEETLSAVTVDNASVFDFNEPVAPLEAEEAATETEETEEASDGLQEEETSEEVEETEEDSEGEPDATPTITRKKPFHIETKDGASKLPPDTLLSIKVDGKISKVPLAEAVDAWNSKEQNEKTFETLSRKEKEVNQAVSQVRTELQSKLETQEYQINTFNQVLKGFYDSAKQGKALVGFAEVLEAAGLNALDVVRGIRAEIIDSADNYLSLSPAERKSIDLQDELEYYKHREAKKAERERVLQERKKAEEEKTSVLTTYGIPDAQTFKQIQAQLVEANGGKPVAPAQVGEYYKAYQQAVFVGGIIKRVDESLLQDKQYIGKLIKLVDAFEPTEAELEQTIRGSISTQETGNGTKSTKPVVRKAQRSGEAKTKNKPLSRENLFL